MIQKIAKNISTLFGLGFKTKMPGTLGSIVGLLTGMLIALYTHKTFFLIQLFLSLILSILLISIYQKSTGKKDSSDIIVDEYIGQQIPFIFYDITLVNFFLFFFLFRFFDIIKIFPADIVDKKYKNSIGVMLDDIIAGFQTSFAIYIINSFLI